jgi:pSer/pThr/pTyr-binding forkhead associated (FHA) protein
VVPERTLHFRGTDRNGRKYGFDLDLDKLMGQRKGVVIGRDIDQSDVVLPHTTVSRRHARLLLAGGVLQVEDLGSTNGTSVDGVRVPAGKRRPLQSGAMLKIGEITLAVGAGE